MYLQKTDNFIVRFSDINLQTPFIKSLNLQSVLTDSQYFNGNENFEDKMLLLETMRINESKAPQK